ncbi:MAG: hypothetical protein A2V70_19920 [Planctomycetes bacterium RBG_13_63_9]|nr:MAG: hypothetical protein A2V70_19920 [Planctomycetes bacterium RBG_13_63_9]
MNLAQMMHQRWAAAEPLNNLLPASHVYTGMAVDPTTPYAVISKERDRPIGFHNDGSAIDAIGVRFEVFHGDYDAGTAIMEQITKTFDRTDFVLSGNDKVINMQRLSDSEVQENDGVWRLTIDFNCTVYRT